jgi:gamma-glutamylcyclotransferase (GGCT)/AIG2-like uncharacterized protein YtfP
MPNHLFVCGTLLSGLTPASIAHLAERFKIVGEATVQGTLYDLGEYPGAVLDERGSERVRGMVFELPDDPAFLLALDDYEGIVPSNEAASLFLRVRTEAVLADDRRIPCWMYVYNREINGQSLVPDGDYRKYLATKANRMKERQ